MVSGTTIVGLLTFNNWICMSSLSLLSYGLREDMQLEFSRVRSAAAHALRSRLVIGAAEPVAKDRDNFEMLSSIEETLILRLLTREVTAGRNTLSLHEIMVAAATTHEIGERDTGCVAFCASALADRVKMERNAIMLFLNEPTNDLTPTRRLRRRADARDRKLARVKQFMQD
uniref:Uncharacterized protein n=2 Tax=Peronospora matthiolae TaxID=2874970 RepID=A0AAV1VK51_9STRA